MSVNLDNYFSRFLHKKQAGVSVASASLEPTLASSSQGGSALGSQPPLRHSGHSDEAGRSPSSPHAAVTVSDSDATATTLDRGHKRPREEEDSLSTAYTGELGDREIAAMLGYGSLSASRARTASPPRATVNTVGDASSDASSSTLVLGEEEEKSRDGGRAMSALGWPTEGSLNRRLENIAGLFTAQFKHELKHSAELYESFEPFLRDRVLDRLDRDAASAHPRQFHRAPAVRLEGLVAAPGCRLRGYQLTGVQFLLDRFHAGMGCVLADDMGLGKTAQVSSFLQALRTLHGIQGPHLVVVPLTTLTGWVRELRRWAPTLDIVKYHGERRARAHMRADKRNRLAVFVTTPAVFIQEKGFFRKRSWVCAVVDEAHVLKQSKTNVSQTARKLTACFRLAVTGTPIQNNVSEVWSLMGFLYSSLVAGYDAAATRDDPVAAVQDCSRLLRHIMLRRTKDALELGLPARVEEPVTLLRPTALQERLLAALTTRALSEEGAAGSTMVGHLSRQRAVCNHPLSIRLLEAARASSGGGGGTALERLARACIPLDAAHIIAPSAKMAHLDAVLPRLRAEGHRCLIFSNFTTTVDLIEGLCHLRGYSYERLDGDCNRVERELSMLRYNSPQSSCFLFLVTTTAGGVGVTLTGADTVILFDSSFNPQMDRQAADRAHRIGQTRDVHIHRLTLEGTVEEHVFRIAQRKASLGNCIVDGAQATVDGADAAQLTADEIRRLFTQLSERRDTGSAGQRQLGQNPCDVEAEAESEEACVGELVRLSEEGVAVPETEGRRGGFGGAQRALTSNVCFVCDERMRPLEALYHCFVCPKAYHAACVGERPPEEGKLAPRSWTCPRHACCRCGKPQSADGALFLCSSCPSSFCFDCLNPRYLELDSDGLRLRHVGRRYDGMEAEGATEQRSYYYMTCMRCCGLDDEDDEGSGSSDDDEEEEEVGLDSAGSATDDEDD